MTAKIRSDEGSDFPRDGFSDSPLEHVRVLYAAFLQGIFSAHPEGYYRWCEAEEETEIVISDENVLHAAKIGQRPGITLSRGPVQAYSLGFDDLLDYSFRTGGKTKSLLIPGVMTIHVSSRKDNVSERLAWYVAHAIWMHRELLMRWGFYDIGRGWAVGAPSPPGSIVQSDVGDEWFTTSVTSPFQFHYTSRRVPLATPVLQAIEGRIQMRSANGRREDGQPYYPAGANNPSFATEESYPLLDGPSNRDGLRRIPHPLNPAKTVIAYSARRPRPLLVGHLPRTTPRVEQSPQQDPPPQQVDIKV